MGIYLRSVHKAHVPIARPATNHKISNNTQKQDPKQNKNNMRGNSNTKSTRAKAMSPEKNIDNLIQKCHR